MHSVGKRINRFIRSDIVGILLALWRDISFGAYRSSNIPLLGKLVYPRARCSRRENDSRARVRSRRTASSAGNRYGMEMVK